LLQHYLKILTTIKLDPCKYPNAVVTTERTEMQTTTDSRMDIQQCCLIPEPLLQQKHLSLIPLFR